MLLMRDMNGFTKEPMNYNYIYIPGNVPSAKNSKQRTKTGIISSKASLRYKHDIAPVYAAKRREFVTTLSSLDPPYNIGFHFIRSTRGRFDFNNMTQMVQDMMVSANWLEDDNVRNMLPFPLMVNDRFVSLSAEMAGVIICVLPQQTAASLNIDDKRLTDY